jgi:uncharacterized protein (TIGR03083 family)
MNATPDPGPILTAHLFAELDARLLELYRSLNVEEWNRASVVPRWTVKDIAGHLLDTALRRLSMGRDGCRPIGRPIASDRDLVDLVNDLNARGVEVYGRLSPRVLIALTEVAVRELSDYLTSLDPMASAAIGVSWAGERQSLNWFDVARELTERWHHQQQIRLAVDRPGIMTRRLYHPVLDTFMRGLPHALRSVEAPDGAVARVEVTGACGGVWHVLRRTNGWTLGTDGNDREAVATVSLPQEIAWRVFTKGIAAEDARALAALEGDERIGRAVLGLVAIVG